MEVIGFKRQKEKITSRCCADNSVASSNSSLRKQESESYKLQTARDQKRQRRHTNYKAQKLVKSWKSTEYTVFNGIYPARRNIIFVEGNKFIASFETHFLFLSSVLKNYQEARSSGAGRSEANCWGASCFEPVGASIVDTTKK